MFLFVYKELFALQRVEEGKREEEEKRKEEMILSSGLQQLGMR